MNAFSTAAAGTTPPTVTPDFNAIKTRQKAAWASGDYAVVGTDAGQAGGMTPPFPAHNLLHKHNCFGLASLANLDQLPAKGAVLIAAPLKIRKGTGSPIRALALVPNR